MVRTLRLGRSLALPQEPRPSDQFVHSPQRLAAVADGVLLVGREFGGCLVQLAYKKERVVSETIAAARGVDDHAFDGVLCRENDSPLRIGQSENADETC